MGAAALLAAGCQQDEIEHYRAPKSELALPATAPGEGKPVRLLAAILHHGDRTWFFKMTGPPPEVAAQEDAFHHFLQSLHFTDHGDKPVSWTVPEGWKEEGGTSMRYATLRAGDKGDVELSVTALGAEAGSLLSNVNRWRGQISLPAISGDELSKVSKAEEIHGEKATLVDMNGTSAGKGAPGMPPFARGAKAPFAGGAPPGHPPVGAEGAPKFTYKVPAGWREESATSVRLASFRVGEPGEDAEVAVTRFPGEVGGMLANVNRWRDQVGLPPITDDQLGKEVQRFDVAGTPGYYVDLTGPGAGGRGPRELLAVGVMRGEYTWFFKMSGPAGVVSKQKAAFEEFVKSVKFGAGPGGNHG
jgi:hypothetical protein